MGRLILLLAFAFAPLLASAHGGHHPAAVPETSAPLAVEASGTIRAVVAAPSRCPGGEENCCCRDAACTPSFQPAAIDAPSVEAAPVRPSGHTVVHGASHAPRTVALSPYSPRGPPARS